MQIKTTMRYHLTPDRMAIIKKTSITIVGKDVQEREPLYTIGRNVNWQLEVSQKLRVTQQFHSWVYILKNSH